MKIRFSLFIFFAFVFCQLSAQNSVFKIKKTLNWSATPDIYNPLGTTQKKFWVFEGSAQHPANPVLPVINFRFPVSGQGNLTPTISNAVYEPFDQLTAEEANLVVSENIELITNIVKNRKEYFGQVQLLPIRRTADGRFERLTYFSLQITHQLIISRPPPPPNTFNSVLQDGLVYKIAVAEDGVYKLDYNFLKDDLKIDIDNINPNQLSLFGNGGGFLPELVASFREDDLVENHIQVIDGGDNSFDSGDYILFYGEGPHKWYFNETFDRYDRPQNPYDTRSYYFLKVDGGEGQRTSEQNSIAAPDYTVTTFNDFARIEEDKINLLGSLARGGHGTGKTWYGDQFNPTRERNYNFEFPNVVASAEADVSVDMALRSSGSSYFNVIAGGETFRSANAIGVNLNEAETQFARSISVNKKFQGAQDNLTIQITNPPDAAQINEGFLDYVQVNVMRNLIMTGNQMDFRNINVRDYANATYEVQGINSNHQIWDITDPLRPRIQKGETSNNTFRFGVNIIPSNPIRNFIVFHQQEGLLSAEAVGLVSNQNIHAINRADMLIVYHPEFESATQRLANHRRENDNLEVVTVPIQQIYNEFSSGKQDPTAIRDFVGMLHRRDDDFKYLLLFGDGSYDYRNITNSPNLDNYIPVYETDVHLNPITGFPADDFFALVSEDDGTTQLNGEVDIAVGRVPARDAFTADKYVDKVIFYDTDPNRFRDWRNQLLFVGDDGDSNRHTNQANEIADSTTERHQYFNVDKILFDAFQRVTTSGGIRFPQANQSLNRNAFRGSLVTNYLGHGGPTGWAQERVLQVEDIESWRNFERLPLIITATCSFAGYDDHTDLPGGEVAVMKPDGGAIALFTTVRAVYSTNNFRLTRGVFDQIFDEVDGAALPMGEILRLSKNGNGVGSTNNRKFTLLGDPSQRLAIPQFNVGTSTINGRSIESSSIPDTLRALEKVTITGYVYDNDGNIMTGFNGRVYPTIYDKISQLQTFGQGGNEVKDFELRKNVLFKGVATVRDGLFSFEFIVPKDIDYNYGFGKISYYAEDGSRDANGFYNEIVIGGTSSNPIVDDQGPIVDVFMNTEDFVTGGTTDKDPVLLVNISDDNGINIGGISIGHDLSAVLDDNTQDTYVLNDYYTAELDDYSKGTVRFPLFDVPEGLHRINVKAWDTSNNSGEGSTEFLVFNSEESALKHVLNYPNPFTTNTNFQFEHQLSGQDLQIMVQVFTVSGKLVKTIEKDTYADGFRVTDVNWDGKDDYGDRLARGVYLYKIKVKSTNAKDENLRSESEFEKLVILK